MKVFRRTLGSPTEFLQDMPALASKFRSLSATEDPDLKVIRRFVAEKQHHLTQDREAFRCTVAAFGELLAGRHGQNLLLTGVFIKKVVVQSGSFHCDLLELFYRCVYEGLDIDESG
jgi:hypothetical protein